MATPRSRHAARLRAHRRRAQARARWFALAVVVGVLGVVVLLLTAFDGGDATARPSRPRPAPLPVTSAPPETQVLATVGNVRMQSPVAQGGVTAVGFHGSDEGALVLQAGRPAGATRGCSRGSGVGSRGRLARGSAGTSSRAGSSNARRRRGRGDRRLLARGRNRRRDPGPGRRRTTIGAEIELRPTSAPSLVVAIENVRPDRALTVGANVAAGSSKLGRVVDISRYEKQALARFAADGGNNVSIEVYPSASLGVP